MLPQSGAKSAPKRGTPPIPKPRYKVINFKLELRPIAPRRLNGEDKRQPDAEPINTVSPLTSARPKRGREGKSSRKSSSASLGYKSNRWKKFNGTPRTPRTTELNTVPEGEPWIWLTREMLGSGALRALSRDAYRALFRILLEHMSQGGCENGRLRVTWRDFEAYGIRRCNTAKAIAELVEAGFIAIEKSGRKRQHAEDPGESAEYRLTYLPVGTPSNIVYPTNRWKRFGEDAVAAKRSIDAASPKRPPLSPKRAARLARLVASRQVPGNI